MNAIFLFFFICALFNFEPQILADDFHVLTSHTIVMSLFSALLRLF